MSEHLPGESEEILRKENLKNVHLLGSGLPEPLRSDNHSDHSTRYWLHQDYLLNGFLMVCHQVMDGRNMFMCGG
jgi:hypothetical protein